MRYCEEGSLFVPHHPSGQSDGAAFFGYGSLLNRMTILLWDFFTNTILTVDTKFAGQICAVLCNCPYAGRLFFRLTKNPLHLNCKLSPAPSSQPYSARLDFVPNAEVL